MGNRLVSLFIESAHPRSAAGVFVDKEQSAPELAFAYDSAIPAPPHSWKDGTAEFRTGPSYDGWVDSDEVAERAEDILVNAIASGELDSELSYEVSSANSGTYGLQSVEVTATIPVERIPDYVTDLQAMTEEAAELRGKLERIVGAWSWSKHEPWAPQETMYHANVQLLVASVSPLDD